MMKILRSVCEWVGLGAVWPQQGQLFRRVVGGGSVREMDDHAAARDALDAQYVQRLSDLCTHSNLEPADHKKDGQEKVIQEDDEASSTAAVEAAYDYDFRRAEEEAESLESDISVVPWSQDRSDGIKMGQQSLEEDLIDPWERLRLVIRDAERAVIMYPVHQERGDGHADASGYHREDAVFVQEMDHDPAEEE